jgi:simple sugar transport system permease protein
MTAASTSMPSGTPGSPGTPGVRARRDLHLGMWLRVTLGVVILSLVSGVANAPDLLSEGSMGAALRFTAPILLAGLGALWAERSGVVNIGLEGMMVMGTWFGAFVGYQAGPLAGILAGVVAGMSFGIALAVLAVSLRVDQAVAGLALNLLAAGLARFLSSVFFDGIDGGTITQSPTVDPLPTISVPGAQVVLEPVAGASVPVVSDVAQVLLGVLTDVSVLTLLVFSLVPITWWVLFRTSLGLRIRACGENPAAADSLGVNPYLHRYIALAVSGAMAGLAGAFLVTVASSVYREGQTGGRGFIGMATVIFGNWMPVQTAIGAFIFGFTDALRTRQEATVGALLLVAAIAFALLAVLRGRHRSVRDAVGWAVAAAMLVSVFVLVPIVPTEFVSFAPHLTTLLVLALARQNLRPPVSLGLPYRRSDNT